MNVGDLVKIKYSHYSPMFIRPNVGEVGIILEVDNDASMGLTYYVQTKDGVWRFSDYELELLDGSG